MIALRAKKKSQFDGTHYDSIFCLEQYVHTLKENSIKCDKRKKQWYDKCSSYCGKSKLA